MNSITGHQQERAINDTQLQELYERSNLTKMQLLFWLEQKLQPDIPLYNMAFTFTLPGKIELAHFSNAFQCLINQSDALRIVIREEQGTPQQHILPYLYYQVEFVDFSSQVDQEDEVRHWQEQRCQCLFDLETRLFDSVLIKRGEEQFIWYICLHHLIIDAWSVSLIFRRVSELYQLSLNGTLTQNMPVYPAFPAYVELESKYRRTKQCALAEVYWQKKLATGSSAIEYYGNPPSVSTTLAQRITYHLGTVKTQHLKACLKQLTRQGALSATTENLAIFYLFATVLCSYLYRMSGKQQLAIGTPIHNRPSEYLKNTLGMLMEMCPLLITIEPGMSFLSLLEEITTEANASLRHYRYTTGNPLVNKFYDVMLNYHSSRYGDFAGIPVQCEMIHSERTNVSFSLVIHDFTENGDLALSFDFNCATFPEATRELAIKHFLRLLDACIEDCRCQIDLVDLLSGEERALFASKINQTAMALPYDQTLIEMFEARAEQQPENLATVMEEQTLTYRQLNQKANQLAHYLRGIGLTPESRVGVCLGRSPEALICQLAIMKAGGAYVPLDPVQPPEALQGMVQHAQITTLLTEEKLISRLSVADARKIRIDHEWPSIAKCSETNLKTSIWSDNLALVLYRRGPSDMLQSVALPHKGLVNTLTALNCYGGVDSNARLLCLSSPDFHLWAYQTLGVLLAGGTVVFPAPGHDYDLQHWADLLLRHAITVWLSPPFLFRRFAEYLHEYGIKPSLRLALLDGDKIPSTLPAQLKKLLPDVKAFTLRGTTETSIHSTIYALEDVESDRKSIPYGHPMANQQVYILDKQMQLVPTGIVGELYIGGMGLARGYVGDASLTAQRFVPDPFVKNGKRLYRTGAMARYESDGKIELLSCEDEQVTIAGLPVAPGMIEAQLRLHPALKDAVVMIREDAQGKKSLVAYVVPASSMT